MRQTAWWIAAVLMWAPAAMGQGQPPAEAATMPMQSVWDFLVKGGVMMIPIAACSLVALTVIVERAVSLRRGRVIPPGFLPDLKRILNDDTAGHETAVEFCRDDDSPIAGVFLAGVKRIDAPEAQRERYIQEAGRREVFKLRRYLRALSVVAAIAPLMGLLGTIFGMIKAFQTVATSGAALGRTELLAKGIYEALITTAAGLLLAIPVLIAHHWIAARIERLIQEMDAITVAFFEERTERISPDREPDIAGPTAADMDADDTFEAAAVPA